MRRKNLTMTNLAMQPFKEEVKDLVVVLTLHLFLTFLRTSLAILQEGLEDQAEDRLVVEEMTYATM